MLYNLHTHSHYCGHGSGEISEYAEYAASKGFSMLGFSEHCPFPTGRFRSTRMPYSEMEKYENDVRSSASGFSFPVLLGYEIDYMEQWHDYFRSVRERVDYFTAGVHFVERPDGTFRTPFNDGFSDDDVRRIVGVLTRFDTLCNDLTSGLPAEIAARQKQYEYYRDKLLTFQPLEKGGA